MDNTTATGYPTSIHTVAGVFRPNKIISHFLDFTGTGTNHKVAKFCWSLLNAPRNTHR